MIDPFKGETIDEITSLVPGLENGMLATDAFVLILKEIKRLRSELGLDDVVSILPVGLSASFERDFE